jgi:hypothetical protein
LFGLIERKTMNIEEARNVHWLKSNPRQLGELLEEGYLTRERLEWAAQWAYNPKLKQAAQVLLENMKSIALKIEEKPKLAQAQPTDNALPINISLEQARTTSWPFAPYKGQPMGTLVESKQLSLKDLGYAIENAWDEKVKRAAIALTLVRLNQAVTEPVPSAGFIHIVSGGRSYSERKQSWLTLIEGMVLGLVIAGMIFLIQWSISDFTKPHPNAKSIAELISLPAQLIATVIVAVLLIIGGLLVGEIPNQITKRLEKQIEEYRLGQEGEDKVVQSILQALDGNWCLFRNISLPGRNKGDLDLVLVGPPGVWALEVKNYRGEFRNTGENWEMRQGRKWAKTFASPSRQALSNAVRLANFLKSDNVKTFVNAVVVWANPEGSLTVKNPSVAVWKYDRLTDELGNIWQGEKLSKAEKDKIFEKFSKLCEAQRKTM